MPELYLSPSVQEYNPYVIGGSEEYYMNLVADAMEPYLVSSGIRFTRNDPDQTVGAAIRQSNAGNYGLHLALHSNAAPASLAGRLQGTDVYYYTGSTEGRRAAEIIAENFKNIYPDPAKVRTVATSQLVEVVRTRAPAVLIEIAYHDNVEDATWIRGNINAIARNLSQSVAEYFGVPFVEATPPRRGRVTAQGALNIRSRPSLFAEVLTEVPYGGELIVNGRWEDWYVVNANGVIGYAYAPYVALEA